MADLNDIYGASNLLKADDLNEGDLEVTIGGWVSKEFDNNGKKTSKAVLTFKDDPRSLVVNITNAKRIAAQFGRDPDRWIGKVIVLTIEPTDFQGRQVNAIRVKPPERKVIKKAPIRDDLNDEVPF